MSDPNSGPVFSEKLLLRLTKEMADAVKNSAREMGKTSSEYVRDALRASLPKRKG